MIRLFRPNITSLAVLATLIVQSSSTLSQPPSPPEPETIEVVELPLPPVSADDAPGACDKTINPHGTGCIAQVGGGSDPETVGILSCGEFLPDNVHAFAMVNFVGAPEAPDPASIYSGEQVILIKSNGEKFPNGDAWKCITCGIPAEQRVGMTEMMDYPQSFDDGKRILVGDNVIDCGSHDLASEDCKPENTFVYPIRWEIADEKGHGGEIRELRIHPDNEHLGWSAFTLVNGEFGQATYYGRLVFNPDPKEGLPLAPRYDLVNVSVLYKTEDATSFLFKDDEIIFRPEVVSIGELRGFSGRGNEAVYIGGILESGNVDAYGISLLTGEKRQLTSHPEYVDPIDISPDEQWSVILDTRATTRHMFLAAMQGVPPLLDIVTVRVVTGVRNNGPRRFFQPWLLDRHGDRGDYIGQKINGGLDGTPGGYDIDDPEWNAMADPRWSLDGTKIIYWQAQTIAPACGEPNPLPCYPSKAWGGRTYRLMMAKLVERDPLALDPVAPFPDYIPWATPYLPGNAPLPRPQVLPGEYIMKGLASGWADVNLIPGRNSTVIESVAVSYYNFSNDGERVLNGWENATTESISLYSTRTEWHSNLTQTAPGGYIATKKSSPDGFFIQLDVMRNFLEINGSLVTTINGVEYGPPETNT